MVRQDLDLRGYRGWCAGFGVIPFLIVLASLRVLRMLFSSVGSQLSSFDLFPDPKHGEQIVCWCLRVY